MISKTYLRYIWLLDTISKARFPLTYEDIVNIWMKSPYAYMGGLPIRTFHEHRKGIEEMFGVKVASVNTSNVKKKPKRLGASSGYASGWKKAVVTLKPESKSIAFFDSMN